MKIRLAIAVIVLFPVLTQAKTGFTGADRPQHFINQLTKDHVDISTRFTGDEITLFGAMSVPGQVVVKVSSPSQPVAIEEKGKIGPFWLSTAKYDVDHIPGLYFLLSSAPMEKLLPNAQRRQYGLDLAYAIKAMQVTPMPKDIGHFRKALLTLKEARHQYAVDDKAVKIHGQHLYSTTIRLPPQLPLGTYNVEIYLVQNGQVVATDHQRINVAEVHMERWVSDVADNSSWLFGISFTLAIMALGVFLGVVMGRSGKKA